MSTGNYSFNCPFFVSDQTTFMKYLLIIYRRCRLFFYTCKGKNVSVKQQLTKPAYISPTPNDTFRFVDLHESPDYIQAGFVNSFES